MIDIQKIKLYADGADVGMARSVIEKYGVQGFTTNPTLTRKAGVIDFEKFAREFAALVHPLPVSLEVFADDLEGMEAQARMIHTWGPNVYVKIPVTDTKKTSTAPLIQKLSIEGIKINTTAVFTKEQIDGLHEVFNGDVPAIVSVFAGRIADAGQDPMEYIRYAVKAFQGKTNVEILWASPREIYNVIQAIECGAHIITVPNDMLSKLSVLGKDLSEFSRETVQMFRNDALASGYVIC